MLFEFTKATEISACLTGAIIYHNRQCDYVLHLPLQNENEHCGNRYNQMKE